MKINEDSAAVRADDARATPWTDIAVGHAPDRGAHGKASKWVGRPSLQAIVIVAVLAAAVAGLLALRSGTGGGHRPGLGQPAGSTGGASEGQAGAAGAGAQAGRSTAGPSAGASSASTAPGAGSGRDSGGSKPAAGPAAVPADIGALPTVVDVRAADTAVCGIKAASVRALVYAPAAAGAPAISPSDALRDAIPLLSSDVQTWSDAARGRPAVAAVIGVANSVLNHWQAALTAFDSGRSAGADAQLRAADADLRKLDGVVANARAALGISC